MNPKHLIWVGMSVGSFIGGYLPLLWGGGAFSVSGVIFSTIGGLTGIWGGFKLSQLF